MGCRTSMRHFCHVTENRIGQIVIIVLMSCIIGIMSYFGYRTQRGIRLVKENPDSECWESILAKLWFDHDDQTKCVLICVVSFCIVIFLCCEFFDIVGDFNLCRACKLTNDTWVQNLSIQFLECARRCFNYRFRRF